MGPIGKQNAAICMQRVSSTALTAARATMIQAKKVHTPPSPKESLPVKKSRTDTSKRDRKRVHNLRKAYEKHVLKHGDPPILFDILEILGKPRVDEILERKEEFERVPPFGEEVVVMIDRLSSHGDGLALTPQGDRLLVVPFALPGEVVRVYPYASDRFIFKSRIVEMLERNAAMRDESLVQCQYFGQCGGCQYQMIPYEQQLELKREVVRRAFIHYSNLDPSLVPEVLPTMPSPERMHYRTKLTPHFDLPASLRRSYGKDVAVEPVDVPIGFDNPSTGRVMDIEECPIGTPVLNEAMKFERQKVRESIRTYKNGATLLLRDSLKSFDSEESMAITDHKATVYERVGSTKFSTPAGAFFQNNRSIIPLVMEYVRSQLPAADEPQYLVDTYCGSGLFALSLAPLFDKVAGVEISVSSIECAKENARQNHILNAEFLAGEAENIFSNISFPRAQTTVVIDPPRRGCDQAFIDQLVALRPRNIIYVSCNVHVRRLYLQ